MSRSLVAILALACTGEPSPTTRPTRVTVSASASPITISQAAIAVDVSAPAAVAAACVRRDDPSEVHLVEGEGSDTITLRFAGLLDDTDYDCTVAPTDALGEPVSVTFRTPPAPADLPKATALADPDVVMTGAYTVMNARTECDGSDQNAIVVLDPEGRNRFHHALPPGTNIGIEVTVDGPGRLLWGGGKSELGSPTVVDVFDGQVWKLAFPGSDALEFHHEGHRIEDGRVLSVADTWQDGWAAFQLRLHDETGAVEWEWDVRTAVAMGWLEAGSPTHLDPHHLNWATVIETERGLEAYTSLCFAYRILAIDVASGAPLWRFGKGGDFTLVDAAGRALEDQEDFPECQHGLDVDGTRLLVYDNGFDRGYTRVVEYELDVDAMTATKTWEWLDEGFWEKYHGGVEWLTPERDRVLVAEGNNDCGGTSDRHSQVVEVDRTTGRAVHRLVLDDIGHWLYRAHRVDGCALFANAKLCPALKARLAELAPVLGSK